jgi:hypothetical protein
MSEAPKGMGPTKFNNFGTFDTKYDAERPDGKEWALEGTPPTYSPAGASISVTSEDLIRCADEWDANVDSHFALAEAELDGMQRLRTGQFPDGVTFGDGFEIWVDHTRDRIRRMRKLHQETTALLRENAEKYRLTEEANTDIAGSVGNPSAKTSVAPPPQPERVADSAPPAPPVDDFPEDDSPATDSYGLS